MSIRREMITNIVQILLIFVVIYLALGNYSPRERTRIN